MSDQSPKPSDDATSQGASDWQTREIEAAIEDLEQGRTIDHRRVVGWLKSWGTESESDPPR